MLFITNRGFNEGYRSIANRKVTFDLDNNAPNNSVFFCYRENGERYVELGSMAFLKEIQQLDVEHILLFIHGFNVLPEEAFATTQLLQKHCDEKKKGSVRVVPIIWPCDNDFGVVKDYWDDQKAADMSAFAFSRAINKFLEWSRQTAKINVCLKRINILAHSMGCRVLRETISTLCRYDLMSGMPQIFRNIFLVAPDIRNEALEFNQPGARISHATRNVLVYYAGDDLALRSSKVINLKNGVASCRLGHTGPADLNKVANNIYAVDCDDVNNVYDFPLGHSYYLNHGNKEVPGVVFEHMFDLIQTGRVTSNTDRKIMLKE